MFYLLILPGESNDGMCGHGVSCPLSSVSEGKFLSAVSRIHDHHNVRLLVGSVSKCGNKERRSVGTFVVDALVSRQDESGEVSHIEIWGLEVNGLSRSVSNDGRVAIAVQMIGSSHGIQDHIPVHPSDRPVVQVSNDIVTIAFSSRPVVIDHARAVAGFSSEKEFVRCDFVRLGEIFELRSGIPVKSSSMGQVTDFRGKGGIEEGINPISNMILVVVVDHDLDVRVVFLHDRRQVITQVSKHIARAVAAALPRRSELRFVLDGHSPELNALALVGRQIGGNVLGVGLVHARLVEETIRFRRSVKLLIDFHPRRG